MKRRDYWIIRTVPDDIRMANFYSGCVHPCTSSRPIVWARNNEYRTLVF